MVAQPKTQTTLAAFEEFIRLPAHLDRRFELLDGEIIEVPSNPFVSVIATRIIAFLSIFIMNNRLKGHITTEGAGFIIQGHVLAPDVAYLDHLPTHKGFGTTPPLLVVEVLSDPTNNTEQTDLRRKLVHYLRAGIVVWVVDFLARQVEVHVPGEAVRLVGEADSLDGGDFLPGFSLPVKDIFPQE